MLDTIISWLNGTRDYNMGAAIYNVVGENHAFKKLFSTGYTLYNNFKLQEELQSICNKLKASSKQSHTIAVGSKYNLEEKKFTKTTENSNPELYEVQKNSTNKFYKEVMNKRAVLFSMVPDDQYTNYNTPDLIKAREQLCLEIVEGYNNVSKDYDKLDFIKANGHLPELNNAVKEDVEAFVNNLSDFEVKPMLDNARKAKNKLVIKEQTPERLSLIQAHQQKIILLEKRWHSLQQK